MGSATCASLAAARLLAGLERTRCGRSADLAHEQTDSDRLVEACLQGDPAAADALVAANWDRLFAYAYRLTLNRADAEDATGEVFLVHLANPANSRSVGGRSIRLAESSSTSVAPPKNWRRN